MSFRRVGWLAATALSTSLWMACGDVYRPVVIPISTTPPNPASFHAVFGISSNVPYNPGAVMQIDVSGDTNIGVANMGMSPTHAGILPNNSRVFVASAGTLFAGDADVVTAFTPAVDSTIASGLGTPTVFSLPNFGPVDPNTGKPSFVCSYLPDFVATTQLTAVYLANFGVDGDPNCNIASTDSVAALSPSLSTISNIAYLPAGAHPVAMVETPDAQNLYVVNQGNNTVADLSPVDLSTRASIPVGSTPVWAVARLDSKRVYVVTQGGGQLVPIDTSTNTVLPSRTNLAVGAGANFVLYDAHLNRLYVANPSNGTVYVFSTTGGIDPSTGLANDTPSLLATILMSAGTNPACPNGCSPVSVTALADGSRFYVASYETAAACPDPNIGSSTSCIIPRLTVFDARSLTVKPISSSLSLLPPSLSLLAQPQFARTQYALVPSASCAPPAAYAPGTTRFRMFTTASADSSHVYVSICDAGSIADISATTSTLANGGTNTPDTLVTDLAAPFGAGPAGSNGQPTPQNPIFLLTGQ